jgi:hypothetical protein
MISRKIGIILIFQNGNDCQWQRVRLHRNKLGEGLGNVIAVLAGVQTLTTSTINSAVNAIQWDGDGLTWNRDVFDAGFNAGLQGAAVGMTTSLTSGLLEQTNLGSKLEKVLGFNSGQIEDMQTFNKTIGGLAGQGVNYALGGDFTMNALNLSMLKINVGGERLEGGLFEVRFGREGVSTAIGAGGVDMSLGTLIDSAGGFVSSARIGGAKVASLFGNERDLSTINSINYLGYTDDANTELARKIWEGKIKATYKDLGVDKNGNIKLGEFNRNNKDEIFLSESLLGNKDKELSAKLATVMAHEGTHLNGNRYEGMAHLQGLETYNAINTIFGLTADKEFSQGMISAIMNPESWVENTGDVDRWEAVQTVNGSWAWLDNQSKDFDIRRILKTPATGDSIRAELEDVLLLSKADGQKYGVLSADRMTTEIADVLPFMNLVFTGATVLRREFGLISLTPEQEANMRNDPSSLSGTKDVMRYNAEHTTDILSSDIFNQTLVEKIFKLPENSACVLSSIAWLNNTYLQQKVGWELNTIGTINVLNGQIGKAYDEKGWVLNRNLVGQLVAGTKALKSAGEYASEGALKRAGYTYYTEERVHINNPAKKHTMAHANGVTYDPEIDTKKPWWKTEGQWKLNRFVAYETP